MTNLEKYNNIKSELTQKVSSTDSIEYFNNLFSTPLNFEEDQFRNKLMIFCPYFLDLIRIASAPKIAEFNSGAGIFLKLSKNINTESSLYFVNSVNSNANLIAQQIIDNTDFELVDIENTDLKFDVIINDGVLNLLSDGEIKELIERILASLSEGGLLLLLINLEPAELRKDFDIHWIHDLIQTESMCLWGKYTFSSLWIKK